MRHRPHGKHVLGVPGQEERDAELHDWLRDNGGAGSGAGGVVRDAAGPGAGEGRA